MELGGYAYIHNASMRVKNVPFLYTPYIVWPAKEERTSGFLVPEIGYSDRKGSELGLAYYKTLGPQLRHHLLPRRLHQGLRRGRQRAAVPAGEGTRGILVAYAVQDPEADEDEGLDEWRWKIDWDHITDDLPAGMRGAVSYHDFSDFDFFRDFERDFDRNTIRTLESSGFVSGNWGPHSLNVLVNEQRTFLGRPPPASAERTITQPSCRRWSTGCAPPPSSGDLPLYLDALSSLSYLSQDRQRTFNDSYGRFDLFPKLTVPIRTVPWLSLSLSAGGRLTWYQRLDLLTGTQFAQLPEEERDSQFRDQSLTRTLPVGLRGPDGSGVQPQLRPKSGPFSKLKHVIEPRFRAVWLGDFDEQGNVPRFDEVDNPENALGGFGIGTTRGGRWSLVNRLLAKPRDGEAEGAAPARSPPSRATQVVSFDDRQPLQPRAPQQPRSRGRCRRASGSARRWKPTSPPRSTTAPS